MGGSKCIRTIGMCLRTSSMSFVEGFIVLCAYLGESTIGGTTVQYIHHRYQIMVHTDVIHTYIADHGPYILYIPYGP